MIRDRQKRNYQSRHVLLVVGILAVSFLLLLWLIRDPLRQTPVLATPDISQLPQYPNAYVLKSGEKVIPYPSGDYVQTTLDEHWTNFHTLDAVDMVYQFYDSFLKNGGWLERPASGSKGSLELLYDHSYHWGSGTAAALTLLLTVRPGDPAEDTNPEYTYVSLIVSHYFQYYPTSTPAPALPTPVPTIAPTLTIN